jgi:hypothetical protein
MTDPERALPDINAAQFDRIFFEYDIVIRHADLHSVRQLAIGAGETQRGDLAA